MSELNANSGNLGRPPRWTPSRDDIQLREDSGRYYRDKNAAKFPNHPFAPAITACLASSPSVLDDVDVVACGSTLGNLLRFVRGQDKKCCQHQAAHSRRPLTAPLPTKGGNNFTQLGFCLPCLRCLLPTQGFITNRQRYKLPTEVAHYIEE